MFVSPFQGFGHDAGIYLCGIRNLRGVPRSPIRQVQSLRCLNDPLVYLLFLFRECLTASAFTSVCRPLRRSLRPWRRRGVGRWISRPGGRIALEVAQNPLDSECRRLEDGDRQRPANRAVFERIMLDERRFVRTQVRSR